MSLPAAENSTQQQRIQREQHEDVFEIGSARDGAVRSGLCQLRDTDLGRRVLPQGCDRRHRRLQLRYHGAMPGDVFRPRWRLLPRSVPARQRRLCLRSEGAPRSRRITPRRDFKSDRRSFEIDQARTRPPQDVAGAVFACTSTIAAFPRTTAGPATPSRRSRRECRPRSARAPRPRRSRAQSRRRRPVPRSRDCAARPSPWS